MDLQKKSRSSTVSLAKYKLYGWLWPPAMSTDAKWLSATTTPSVSKDTPNPIRESEYRPRHDVLLEDLQTREVTLAEVIAGEVHNAVPITLLRGIYPAC